MSTDFKTNAEWNQLFEQYTNSAEDTDFIELYEALTPMARKIANQQFKKFRFLGAERSEFLNEAEFAIFKTVKQFDPEKGSLPALLKQMIIWGISDNIVRPRNTEQGKFNRDALSLDEPVSSGGTTLLDVAEHEFAIEEDEVFGEVNNSDKKDFVEEVKELVQEFDEEAKESEGQIVTVVFKTILRKPQATAQTINKVLYSEFPEAKKATLRKRKERALDKFTGFAQENGFIHADLSQY